MLWAARLQRRNGEQACETSPGSAESQEPEDEENDDNEADDIDDLVQLFPSVLLAAHTMSDYAVEVWATQHGSASAPCFSR